MIVWGGNSVSGQLEHRRPLRPGDRHLGRHVSQRRRPPGRRLHTAVWTGSEMIVWGGHDDVGRQNTGGRYDPATDSWTPTSTTGAPRHRYSHTAVWTGTEMIVWGGDNSPWRTNTGGRYCASNVLGIDFGDAPDPTYPTLLRLDGARHIFDGLLISAPPWTTRPTASRPRAPTATTSTASDDEDGVVFTSGIGAGLDAYLDVTASGAGLLNAWVDFNSDGDWADAGEQIFTDRTLAAGVNSLSFAVPARATARHHLRALPARLRPAGSSSERLRHRRRGRGLRGRDRRRPRSPDRDDRLHRPRAVGSSVDLHHHRDQQWAASGEFGHRHGHASGRADLRVIDPGRPGLHLRSATP